MKLLFDRYEEYKSLSVKTYAADSAITAVLARLGWEYKFINIDSAVFYCNEALRIAKNIKFVRGTGSVYNQIAAIYRQRGDFTKSLEFHNKALEVWRSFQKTNPSYYKSAIIIDEARTLNNMGIIYHQTGETKKAMDLYLQALKIDQERGNIDGAANKLGNIGNLFKSQGQFDQALKYYLQVMKIDEKVGNKSRMAECYNNMGLVSLKTGEMAKAKEYHRLAIEILQASDNKRGLTGWEQVLVEWRAINAKLGESVDVRVAALQYFLRRERKLQNPAIVELRVLRPDLHG